MQTATATTLEPSYDPPKFNIRALVAHIHECEKMMKTQGYLDREVLRYSRNFDYLENYMTCLYITRAWHRGKLHRKNPPEPLRNRSLDTGLDHEWDAEFHASQISKAIMKAFPLDPQDPQDKDA